MTVDEIRRFRICGGPTGADVHVTDEQGREVMFITKLTIYVSGSGLVYADIEALGPEFDITLDASQVRFLPETPKDSKP